MRATEKLELISRIGRELQRRFSYDEINGYLAEFKVTPPAPGTVGSISKWVYSKAALQGVPADIIIAIAEDLELENLHAQHGVSVAPQNWTGTTKFRLFISHIAKHKGKATRLKECLASYSVSGFVAHEDIHPTLEWQVEIERALYNMDAFLAIHTPGFKDSFWTQQEVGFALGRGAKIISFKMGEDPTGFISRQQALARQGKTAERIAQEVDTILSADPLTSGKLQLAKDADNPKPKAAVDWNGEIPF